MSQLKRKGPIAKVNELAEKMETTVLWDRTDDNHQKICSLDYVEIKLPGVYAGAAGYGRTPSSAATAYLRKIVGQLLVKNAGNKHRQYFVVVPLGDQLKVIVIPKD